MGFSKSLIYPVSHFSNIPLFRLISSPSSSPAKDTGLSRRQQGFESPWGRQIYYRRASASVGLFFGSLIRPRASRFWRDNRGSTPVFYGIFHDGASPSNYENPPQSPFACLWQEKDYQRGIITPPFGLRPRLRPRGASAPEGAVSDPEGKGRRGGI